MRILQLIDTLHPGGAERMALNYFLAIKKFGYGSYIVVSREEGLLAKDIRHSPAYTFLNKSSTFDLSAFYKLKKIISINKIDIIQAHGSSWFWAVVCKISGSKIKVVWHDHYGDSENLDQRDTTLLRKFSKYFDGIISVNNELLNWAKCILSFKKTLVYLPNFVKPALSLKRDLKGNQEFKIICVANLRPQKDHFTLIKAFELIQEKYDVSLHLFGRNFQDEYSHVIIGLIENNKNIFYYGESNDILDYLKSADIGVLTSKSEGLPLTVLEYGIAGIPVVCTDAGACGDIIGDYGKVVKIENPKKLSQALKVYLNNRERARRDSSNFQIKVKNNYSESAVLQQYSDFLTRI